MRLVQLNQTHNQVNIFISKPNISENTENIT